jgi:hypothetical protein
MSKFYEDDGGTCTAAGISGSGKSGTVCADSFKDFVPQNCLTVACADKEKKLEGVKMANRIAESAMADVDIYEQDFEQGIKDALDETSARDLCVNNEDIRFAILTPSSFFSLSAQATVKQFCGTKSLKLSAHTVPDFPLPDMPAAVQVPPSSS